MTAEQFTQPAVAVGMEPGRTAAIAEGLGREFLTWLWFASEAHGGRFDLPGVEDVFCYLVQKITVVGGEGESLERIVISGRMADMQEAKSGLLSGKMVQQAGLRFEKGSEVWEMNVRSEDLAFNGLRTPKVDSRLEEGEDPEGPFLEKMYLLEQAARILDELFALFIRRRFSPEWPGILERMAAWAGGKERSI